MQEPGHYAGQAVATNSVFEADGLGIASVLDSAHLDRSVEYQLDRDCILLDLRWLLGSVTSPSNATPEHLGGLITDALGLGPMTYIGSNTSEPGRPTTTLDNMGNAIGLHLDNWQRLPCNQRHLSQSRLTLNLGAGTRHLIVLGNVVDCRETGLDPASIPTTNVLREYYTNAFREIRCQIVNIPPGFAYIAPTERLLHDGSTWHAQLPSTAAMWHCALAPVSAANGSHLLALSPRIREAIERAACEVDIPNGSPQTTRSREAGIRYSDYLPSKQVAAVVRDRQIVAISWLTRRRDLQQLSVVTRPEWRRRGLGSRIVSELADRRDDASPLVAKVAHHDEPGNSLFTAIGWIGESSKKCQVYRPQGIGS